MFNKIRIFLWHIAAELEYILYPWKEDNPAPPETIVKYNLPQQSFDENLHYDWLKSHDEKISRLQKEMIYVQKRMNEIQNGQK
jgi:hypothetical protein